MFDMGSHDRRHQAGVDTIHLGLVLKAEIEHRVGEASGMLLADHEALANLAEHGGALRMSEIADRLILTRGGVTKLVDRLEEVGYVERRPSPSDRRVVLVAMTPEGREALRGSQAAFDAALHDLWGRHLTDEEAATVLPIIDRIRAAMHPTQG
ncbi:MAG: MarR family transcriptional regulator [Acidimicrobiia bacterium]|jgi:DNA-binding MarR family transcriptional regulator